MITRDECLICGYNLTGFTDDTPCAECGVLAGDSRDGRFIKTAPIEHRRSLASGAHMAFRCAEYLLLLAALESIVLAVSVGVQDAAPSDLQYVLTTAQRWIQAAIEALVLVFLIVRAVAWWRLSAPDQRSAISDRHARLRLVLRSMVVAHPIFAGVTLGATIATNVFLALLYRSQAFSSRLSDVQTIGLIGEAGVAVALIVGFFAFALYVRVLARRLDDARIHTRATRLLWLAPTLVAAYVGTLVALEYLFGIAGYSTSSFYTVAAIDVAVVAVWYVLWARLLKQLAARLVVEPE